MNLPLGHPVARGVEDFLVAPSNRVAVAWIDRWPEWPGPALALVGPPGSGKTHLAGLWRERAGATIIDPIVDGLERTLDAARAGPVLVDDAARVAGDRAAETTLLMLYNAIKESGGALLLTAGVPPPAWGIALFDLRSRLNTAIVATIDPPDDGLLQSLALKLLADRQMPVTEDLLAVLVTRAPRSFAGLAAAIARIDDTALADGKRVSATLARDLLKDPAGDPD